MRRLAWLTVPAVLVGLLGVAIFATRGPGPTTAFTLRPGDCFDIPTDAQVGDIATVDCTAAHDAEVFVAAPIAGASSASGSATASGSALASPLESEPGSELSSEAGSASIALPGYPGEAAIAGWVSTSCGAAAQRDYLGSDATAQEDLVVGYFFPTPDAWAHGERQVTCYLHAVGSRLSGPLRSGGSGAASPS